MKIKIPSVIKMANKWIFSYNSGAEAYDRFSSHQDADNLITRTLGVHYPFNGKDVLEIGCGSGKFTSQFAKLAKRYYALDKSQNMVDLATKKCGNLENLMFFNQSAENIPLPIDSLDIIFGSWALTSMGDIGEQRNVVKEIKRVLRPGGSIVLVENYWESEFTNMLGISSDYDHSTIKPLVEEFGFKIEHDLLTKIKFRDIDCARRVLKGAFQNTDIDKFMTKKTTPEMDHRVVILHGIN